MDSRLHARIQRSGAPQIAASFLAQPFGQVARTALAVHGFAVCTQAKSLFSALVGLDFGAHEDSIFGGGVQFAKCVISGGS